MGDALAAKPCMMGKAGRAQFYSAYEIRARRLRRAMRITARYWLGVLQAEHSLPAPAEWVHDDDDRIDWGDA